VQHKSFLTVEIGGGGRDCFTTPGPESIIVVQQGL
jgi:hypothetical protein